ncbi:VOC family protein [Opitutaceae bacterium EW11]|nr:VOC family protein [Opitutaceae bacterium EW11]
MATTLCWSDIPVRDIDRAVSFYSAVLGAPTQKMTLEGGIVFGLLPGSDTGASGCLVVGPDYVPSHQGPLVYLSVEGRLDAAVECVRKSGGKVLEEKHQIGPHGFRVIVEDSEGNRVALHSMAP